MCPTEMNEDMHGSLFGGSNHQGSWLLAMAGYITILIMVVGLIGNVVTIIALLRFPRIRNVTAAFIISLGIADALFCAIVLPFNAWRFFNDSWTSNGTLCKLIPFLQYANVGLSLLFIAMITINRYVMITHHAIYTRMYKPVYVAAMIVFCLVLSFGLQIPTLFGVWGKYQPNPVLRTCTITKDESGHSSKTSLFVIGFVVPCIIIICCYTRIFWAVRSSEKKMRRHYRADQRASVHNILETPTPVTRDRKKRNEWRITKMVLAIFFSFLICYLPITVTKVIDKDVNYLPLHIVSYLMLYMSACVNPIIYVIMNKQYRKAFSNILTCPAAHLFSNTSVKPNEQPSKTMISQVSVSMVPMNALNNGCRSDSSKS